MWWMFYYSHVPFYILYEELELLDILPLDRETETVIKSLNED